MEIAHKSGGRIVGPNIVGILLNGCNANASFVPSLPYRGHTALVSQSGALLIALQGVTFPSQLRMLFHGFPLVTWLTSIFADTINYYATDKETRLHCIVR